MRLLLALFLGLAGQALAAADTLQVLYINSNCATEQSLTDCSGNGRTLISGTTAITITSSIKCEGSYSLTGFNSLVVVRVPDPTSWANDMSVTAQQYFYTNTLASYSIFAYSNFTLSQTNAIYLRADGGLNFDYYGARTSTAASVIAINTCYWIGSHWGADGQGLYVVANPTLPNAAFNIPLLSASGASTGAFALNANAMQYGRFPPAGGLDCAGCYMDSMRVSTGDRPTFPTTDMHVPSGATRSMDLKNVMRMNLCCGSL